MTPESFLNGRVTLWCADMRDALARLEENSVDSCVTDPPYHLTSIVKRFGKTSQADSTDTSARARAGADGMARLSRGFMGRTWDGGDVAFQVDTWRAVYRALKPGAHLVAFSGTRTYHRMVCAIEDAGFEVRDQIGWAFGSGFPKSHDVSKGIDKSLGAQREKVRVDASHLKNPPNLVGGAVKGDDRPWRQAALERGYHEADGDEPATAARRLWDGWGTALKPAWEPVVLARKPLSEGIVAANVLRWGTGALNIDGCRVAADGEEFHAPQSNPESRTGVVGIAMQATGDAARNHAAQRASIERTAALGRWPANVIHDGSEEVVGVFPDADGAVSNGRKGAQGLYEDGIGAAPQIASYADVGSAARFFYTAKADSDDRLGSKHPTVKPLDLMQYLVRLVTPPKGIVLDCFAGTGTTGEAAYREGCNAILIEREPEYQDDIRRRMALVLAGPDERAREAIKAKLKDKPADNGPLFSDLWKEPYYNEDGSIRTPPREATA